MPKTPSASLPPALPLLYGAVISSCVEDDVDEIVCEEDEDDTRGKQEALRTWLAKHAGIQQARLEPLCVVLRDEWVDDLDSLRDAIGALEARLPAAAHRMISQALLREQEHV